MSSYGGRNWRDVMIAEGTYRPKYPESPFVHMADMVNPETGKTTRETNLERPHLYPVGALVEIVSEDSPPQHAGLRLRVVEHNRDCDGTPLYGLGAPACGEAPAEVWTRGWPDDALAERSTRRGPRT